MATQTPPLSSHEASSGQSAAVTPARSAPVPPLTLAIDVGGTGLKASVLDSNGAMVADRVRVDTTYPLPPATLVDDLAQLVAPLPAAHRVSVGFPGMVRNGRVLSAPHFVTVKGPGSAIDQHLVDQWAAFDLAGALRTRLGEPTRVANDADLQGAAVIKGQGFEMVITLGTGVGTAFFYEGRILPHFEFAHAPFRKGETYNEQLGDPARKTVGSHRWNRRVKKAIGVFRALTFFDHCFVGGGNSGRVSVDLGADVSIVDNSAGILGGIKLWEGDHLAL